MKKLILVISLLLFFSSFAQGFGGGCAHFSNPSPSMGETDVSIEAKGVQTCIDITVDSGCTVNVTFQWYNWTESLDNGYWWFEEAYWYTYASWIGINHSQTLCEYQGNVTCATENWWTQYADWRIIANFTCPQETYDEQCWFYYQPEVCPIFQYIYPPWNATVCPCCDAMCFGINNTNGNPMNVSIYRNDSLNETFYLVNKYVTISNGTYCFCLDGHMSDIYYPMRFNETYNWYINVTDTVTSETNNSAIYQFHTAKNISYCPCVREPIIDRVRDDSWIFGVAVMFSVIPLALIRKRRKE